MDLVLLGIRFKINALKPALISIPSRPWAGELTALFVIGLNSAAKRSKYATSTNEMLERLLFALQLYSHTVLACHLRP